MKTLTYKFYLITAVITLGFVGAFFVLDQSHNERETRNKAQNEGEARAVVYTNTNVKNNNDISNSKENSIATKKFTTADSKEFTEWMAERGKFTNKEREDYQHYDPKTLESLAETGDLKAIEALAGLHLSNGDRQSAIRYYEIGAVRGSTEAIEMLGIMATPKSSIETEKRRPAALEALAINKVLELRGDEERFKMETDALINFYESFFNEKLNISFEDQDKIDQRALEIYNDWEAKRKELGLGEFDNSKPLGAKKFFDLVKSSVSTH
jgi:hypothetical protein